MTLYMDDLIGINDELIKIATQIRSRNLRRFRHKTHLHCEAENSNPDTYTEVLRAFRRRGIEQTLISARRRMMSIDQAETSPVLRNCDEFLVDRLSKANDFRRQLFEHWRMQRSHSPREITDAAVAADTADVRLVTWDRKPLKTVQPDRETFRTMSMPSESVAAPDLELRSLRSARTNQSRALSVHAPSGDPIIWPEVPSSVPNGKDFECPLCFFICPKEQRTGEPWRYHEPTKCIDFCKSHY